MSRSWVAEFIHELEADSKFKQGLELGGNEAFASLVIHGYCIIAGRELQVSFTWQDERHEEMVRELSRQIMQRAYDAGRQAEPPTV